MLVTLQSRNTRRISRERESGLSWQLRQSLTWRLSSLVWLLVYVFFNSFSLASLTFCLLSFSADAMISFPVYLLLLPGTHSREWTFPQEKKLVFLCIREESEWVWQKHRKRQEQERRRQRHHEKRVEWAQHQPPSLLSWVRDREMERTGMTCSLKLQLVLELLVELMLLCSSCSFMSDTCFSLVNVLLRHTHFSVIEHLVFDDYKCVSCWSIFLVLFPVCLSLIPSLTGREWVFVRRILVSNICVWSTASALFISLSLSFSPSSLKTPGKQDLRLEFWFET